VAHNSIHINASPEAVFAVLADPRSYAYWVVGSREVRSADAHWPAPGSAFDHAVGIGPLRIRDVSYVEEARPPELLQLRTKARPLGTARVTLRLRPSGAGTDLTMVEDPADRLTALGFNRLTHGLVRVRNARSLDRLKRLAEGHLPVPAGRLPARSQRDDPPPETGPVRNPGSRRRAPRRTANTG
jgi:uncharacterized protein YndB with AHSA1/START domain